MPSSPEPFYIRKSRGTLQILFDTIRYLGKNANALVLSAGFFALPFILISKAVASYITGDASPFDQSVFYMNELSKNTLILFWILFAIFVLGLGIYNFILTNLWRSPTFRPQPQPLRTRSNKALRKLSKHGSRIS